MRGQPPAHDRLGPAICLTCEPDEIVRRLAAAQDRPLLDVDDRGQEIERLLSRRAAAYAAIPRQIDTTGLSVDDGRGAGRRAGTSVLLLVRHPGGSYPIHVGRGCWTGWARWCARRCPGRGWPWSPIPPSPPSMAPRPWLRCAQAGFAPLLLHHARRRAAQDAGHAGRAVRPVCRRGGLDRSGAVLALGGGVICDVAGFAAATYMRGLPVIQVPTTLLAMVDASVGGKTAVDLPQGKNLVGAFKQPALVAIDPDVLDTLPGAEVASGMAELIKHGVLADGELFDELAGWAPWAQAPRTRWIARSLQVKIDVVEEDPYERGRRAVLNLGHTAGHALEQLSGYRHAPRRGGEHRHGRRGAHRGRAGTWPSLACRRASQGCLSRTTCRWPARPMDADSGVGGDGPRQEKAGQGPALGAAQRGRRGRDLLEVPQEVVLGVLHDMGAG